MDVNQLGSSNQIKTIKTIKTEEMISSKSKSKTSLFSYIKNIFHLLICFGNIFKFLFNKISLCFSKCSIIVQFSIILIPISIALIIIIFFIHFYFYSNLYTFNFSKLFKEEYFDLYITEIDDLKTELTALVVKENKIDVENHLFFQVYFRELTSIGFFDDGNNFLEKFSDNNDSISLYSELNNIKTADVNFTIDQELATTNIDEREYDQLGKFAQIYYYMFPHIWYESFQTKAIINQSFFIAYEFGDREEENWDDWDDDDDWDDWDDDDWDDWDDDSEGEWDYDYDYGYDDSESEWDYDDSEGWRRLDDVKIREIKNESLFFRFPKNKAGFTIYNNFVSSNLLLNPQVENYKDEDFWYAVDNFYLDKNWFNLIDYNFRMSVNTDEQDFATKISLAHLNVEGDGIINKTFITYSQQYFKHENRTYIINIIFFVNQLDLQEGDIDYSFFIVKDNNTDTLVNENEISKFSNNISFVASYSDIIEYSLAKMDYRFFHLGLYDNNNNFYKDGIFFDTFNLDYFYDYSQFYSTSKEGEYDYKFYVALYLYKSLFQNVKYSKIHKIGDEIFLYNFKDENKIRQICEKIDFESYKSYFEYADIDCWETRNRIYYDEKEFLYITMKNDSFSKDPIYPYCSCLPLFCFKNYKDLDVNLNNFEFSNEINLPNKCQNKFINYRSDSSNSSNAKIPKLLNISLDSINYDYNKILYLELNQFSGYFLFIISQIKTTGEVYIHTYYKLLTKIEIIILVLFVLIMTSILSIIIIYINMKRYSLIISNFKQKFEYYVFHSDNRDESISSKENNFNIFMKNKECEKIDEKLRNDGIIQILEKDSLMSKDFSNVNENNLLDDLFLIFSQAYNICSEDIENFYSLQNHKSKNQMKIDMMKEKNELFQLLSIFCLNAPFFQLNLNFDYNMYEQSEIMKKYERHVRQLENIDKEKTRLTENILCELISTECVADYGLITNFNFKYITNIKSDSRENIIKYTMFENIKNKQKKEQENLREESKKGEMKIKKLVWKRKSVLINFFKKGFESDDFLNYNKLDSAFNFFLINSYYKYYKQIVAENEISY